MADRRRGIRAAGAAARADGDELHLVARADPAQVPQHRPGSTVQVVALINSDLRKPVRSPPAPLEIDGAATPPAQTLRPIKETLVRLRDQMKVATPAPDKAGAVADSARGEVAREAAFASLEAYLKADMPPQPLRWSIRTPPGVQGRFPLTVTAPALTTGADSRPVTTTLVIGDRPPPAPAVVDGPASSAVRSIEINYPKANAREDVWTPLRWMRPEWQWVVLYLLAYLPVMFGLRRCFGWRSGRGIARGRAKPSSLARYSGRGRG